MDTTRENSNKTKGMVKEIIIGRMGSFTRDSGNKDLKMVLAYGDQEKEIVILDNGNKERSKAMEFILLPETNVTKVSLNPS